MMERSQSLAPDSKPSVLLDPYTRAETKLGEHHGYSREASESRARKEHQYIPRNVTTINQQFEGPTDPHAAQYHPTETRGRQYQIPMRYEFQKNIVHVDTPSQGPQQLHTQSQQRPPHINGNNIFPANYAVNKVLSREGSMTSTRSEMDLRRRVHSPFMHNRKNNTTINNNANNTTTSYTDFKRHSISGAVGGNTITSRDYSSERHKKALINAYNDSKVFDTVIPPRSISRKSVANIHYTSSNHPLNVNATVTSSNVPSERGEHTSSMTSEKSLVSMMRKGVSINKPPPLEAAQTFASSISKINYYNNNLNLNNGIVHNLNNIDINSNSNSNINNHHNKFDEPSDKNIHQFISDYQNQQQQLPLQRIRSSHHLQYASDNSGKQMKSKMGIVRASRTASVDMSNSSSADDDEHESDSDSDSENDADTEIEIPGDDDNNSLSTKRTTLSDVSTGTYDYGSGSANANNFQFGVERMPMRTQQRQLAIKDLTTERKSGISAWLELANESSSTNLHGSGGGDTIIDIAKQNERQQQQSNSTIGNSNTPPIAGEHDAEGNGEINHTMSRHAWSKVSIQERNTYERISNDLRKLALFNKRPMADSLERYVEFSGFNNNSGEETHIKNKAEMATFSANGRGVTRQHDDLHVSHSYMDNATGTFKLGAGRDTASLIWENASARLLSPQVALKGEL